MTAQKCLCIIYGASKGGRKDYKAQSFNGWAFFIYSIRVLSLLLAKKASMSA